MKQQPKKTFKHRLAALVMGLLGRGMRYGYKKDSRVKSEFDSLGDDCKIKLTINPTGPSLMFGKKESNFFFEKCNHLDEADITLAFKGINGAIKMFTGRMGLATGYAQHRFTVKGDLYKVMSIVRVMNIVEAYLFPKFISKNLMNPIPKRELCMLRFYGGTLFSK